MGEPALGWAPLSAALGGFFWLTPIAALYLVQLLTPWASKRES